MTLSLVDSRTRSHRMIRGERPSRCRLPMAIAAAIAGSSVLPAWADDDSISVLPLINVEAQAPMASPVVDVSQGHAKGNLDLGEQLREVNGVSGSRLGSHGVSAIFRGQSGERLIQEVDGATLYPACPGGMDTTLGYATTGSQSDLTLYKGAQTVSRGPNFAAGTLEVTRQTPSRDDDDGVHGSVGVGWRSNDDATSENLSLTAKQGDFWAAVDLEHSERNNYEDGNGDTQYGGYRSDNGSLRVGAFATEDVAIEAGVAVVRIDDALYPTMDAPRSDMDRQFLKLTVDNVGPFSHTETQVNHARVVHDMDNVTLRDFDDSSSSMDMDMGSDMDMSDMAMFSSATTETWYASTQGDIPLTVGGHDATLTLGADAERLESNTHSQMGMSLDSLSDSQTWPDVVRTRGGVFAELDTTLDADNRLVTGARYDVSISDARDADEVVGSNASAISAWRAQYGDDVEAKQRDGEFSALARLEHRVNDDLKGYAALSRSVRFPTASERYYNYQSDSDGWLGNPELDPEIHQQLELGLSGQQGAWHYSADTYYNRVHDWIELTEGDSLTTYDNVEAEIYGVELEASWQQHGWRHSAGVAATHGTNLTDSTPLSQVAPFNGYLATRYDADRWWAGARFDVAARQSRISDSEDATAGFGIVGLEGGYRATDAIELSAGISNLFDKAYAYHVNRFYDDPLQGDVQVNEPGRIFWTHASWSF
ncbi:TonB-dependent receptor domain-containing protein [Cobetia sp. L2A1]|uniref:TonB-dependent receptor domain-containing protein n=1 Tax=Cobetia sp. L2A1 TaxID=2686360 RepID=UPI00131AEB77|nr:TonB-dependent receptor [Cobetia sp. L2A1]